MIKSTTTTTTTTTKLKPIGFLMVLMLIPSALFSQCTTPPTAVCQNINVYLDGTGNATILPTDLDGGSLDNCATGLTFSASQAAFTCADLGANLVTLTATDGLGNFDNCVSTVTVLDTVSPVIACPGDQTETPDAACNFTLPDYTSLVTASDACSGAGVVAAWINEFHYDNTGADVGEGVEVAGVAGMDLTNWSLVLYNGSNGTTYTTVPLSGIIPNESGGFGALNFAIAGIQNGGPDGIALLDNGAVVEFISYEGTFTATNGPANGMISTNVGISETSSTPVGESLQLTGSGSQASDFTWSGPLISSYGFLNANQTLMAAGGVTVTQSPAASTVISGTTTITMTATDGNGNTSSCTFDVTLNDATPPTVVCQNVNVYLDGAGNTSIVAADLDGGSTDNCSGLTLSASVTAFTCADLGPNNVTLTVTDGNANSSNCVSVVTVLDTISPVVTCPGDQAETASVNCDFLLPDYTTIATATDNCGGTPTITQSPAVGVLINANTLITMTTNDGNGNTSTCTFNVNLDFSACVGAECSNAIAVALAPCGGTQTETGSTVGGTTSTETSFCGTSAGTGGANWYTFTGDGGDWTASLVNAGTNYDTKIWVYDGLCGSLNCVTGNDDFVGVQSQVTFPTIAGNTYYVVIGGFSSSEGNFELTFSNVETIAPVADLATLADVTGVCEVTSLTDPTATDNCSVVTVTNDVTLPISTNSTITWTYTDADGNFSTQTQNVVLVDGIAPTASNPADSSYECVGDAIIDVTVVTDEADNCTGLVTVTHVGDVVNGNGCQDTITRTYNVADVSGNNIDVVQMIFIEDITAPTASSPLSLTVQCIGEVPAPSTGWVSDEADNCVAPTVAFVSDVSDGLLCPETISRTFSVTDACGNSIDVVQLVIVMDLDAPVSDIAALPELTSLCGVTPATATATDNCDGALDGVSDVTFPITVLGTTTVTWTYTDACGNMSTQTQDVTISAIDVSVVMASDNITFVANNNPGSGVTYQWIDCDLDQPIAGETNHNYTPTYGSNFAVIITEAGCSDTSACMPSTVGIEGLDIKTLVLYPNPTNGVLNIDFEGAIKSIEVVDMLGRVIVLPISVIEKTVDGSSLTTGKYMIRITTESDQVLVEEFVVQK